MTLLDAPHEAPHGVVRWAVGSAREHIKDVLDASDNGQLPVITRAGRQHAVIPASWLRTVLAQAVPAKTRVGQEADYWYVILDGRNLATSAPSLDEALEDMVEELREYAADWHDELRLAPNHSENRDLVTLVDLSSDQELRDWLEA